MGVPSRRAPYILREHIKGRAGPPTRRTPFTGSDFHAESRVPVFRSRCLRMLTVTAQAFGAVLLQGRTKNKQTKRQL